MGKVEHSLFRRRYQAATRVGLEHFDPNDVDVPNHEPDGCKAICQSKVFAAARRCDNRERDRAGNCMVYPSGGQTHQRVSAGTEFSRADPGGRTFQRRQPVSTNSILRDDGEEAVGESVQ
jgi:hypothetical protein